MKQENQIVPVEHSYPEGVFILPVRHRPIFPGMLVPIVISNKRTITALKTILNKDKYLGVILQKDDTLPNIDIKNLYKVGTLVYVVKTVNLPDEGIQLMVNAMVRFTIKDVVYSHSNIYAKVSYHKDVVSKKDRETKAILQAVISITKNIFSQSSVFTEEMKLALMNVEEPGQIADFTCNVINLEKKELQEILETVDVKERLNKALNFLTRELEIIKLQNKIQGKVAHKVESSQREYMLREQLKAIHRELGSSESSSEKNANYYREKIKNLVLPEEANTRCNEEINKLDIIEMRSPEYGVICNYLDFIIKLPWEESEFHEVNIKSARTNLNKHHFGLVKPKERILEQLAVRNLLGQEKGLILCLVGPPGTGKTSLGKAIANSMKKKFFRFSVGGVKDEAEIKGHRRTYIGAMPGKILQALATVRVNDMVLLIDEIDKLGTSFQGDPASALLEVMDPEQNNDFRDHYYLHYNCK